MEQDGTLSSGMTLQVMGSFQLRVDDAPALLPVQSQRVLAFLSVCGRSHRRGQLAGRLWPYTNQERAQANLRTALWKIRQRAPAALETRREQVSLSAAVEVDLEHFESAARILTEATTDRPDAPDVATFRTDLLPGWDEEWLLLEQERVRQLRLHALESLSHRFTSEGRYTDAVDAALTAVRLEPLRESAQLALADAFIAEGNVADALRHLHRYRSLLSSELGIKPSPRYMAAVDALGAPPGDKPTPTRSLEQRGAVLSI